jgi:peptidoglycan/LPS O-acetylase OafA/YrhL
MVAAVMVCRVMAPDDQSLHTLLYTRGIGIVTGCAVALSLAPGLPRPIAAAVRAPLMRWGVAAACAAFVVVGTWLLAHDRIDVQVGHQLLVPIAAVLFSALIALLWHGPADRLSRLLSWRPLAYVGTISYGIYLYHALLKFIIWDRDFPRLENHPHWIKVPLRLLLYYVGAVAVASVSSFVVERPFLRLKERLR